LVATDSSGNVFVVGLQSTNVFKITPGGVITEIIDNTGDGTNTLGEPGGIAIDSSGNVFVGGPQFDKVFKIATPGTCSTSGTPCTITTIIDSTGDGAGNIFDGPRLVATDSSGNVFVSAANSNVFKIATPGTCSTSGTPCTITEILDSTGDGAGNTVGVANGVATDSSGNVFLAASVSSNVFKIATPGTCSTNGPLCVITEILDSTGDGAGNTFSNPFNVATDSSGNVFAVGVSSDNVFKITPAGVKTQIIGPTGDGAGNILDDPFNAATDSSGNVFVAGRESNNAFQITPAGVITEIIDVAGGGGANPLKTANGIAADSFGHVFVVGLGSGNVFEIDLSPVSSGSSIGGTLIPIDTTALLIAGAYTMTPWLILGVLSAVGIGLAVFTLKRSR